MAVVMAMTGRMLRVEHDDDDDDDDDGDGVWEQSEIKSVSCCSVQEPFDWTEGEPPPPTESIPF